MQYTEMTEYFNALPRKLHHLHKRCIKSDNRHSGNIGLNGKKTEMRSE